MNERYLLEKFYKIDFFDNTKRDAISCLGVSDYELLIKDKYGNIISYDDYEENARCVLNIDRTDEIDQSFEFSYRLYKIMKRKGITQQELADTGVVTQAQLSKYLNYKAVPNFFTIMKIASVLDCGVNEFGCIYSDDKAIDVKGFKNV